MILIIHNDNNNINIDSSVDINDDTSNDNNISRDSPRAHYIRRFKDCY